MKVVIDTNVLISSIGKNSPYRKLFDCLLNGSIELQLSNDIFWEYKEILSKKTNSEIAKNFTALLTILPNVNFINVYFKWKLIDNDPDDNKFVDCYLSSNSDFLITEDNHFEILNYLEFPRINVIRTKEFLENIIDVNID